MGMEALITLNCRGYSENVADIVKIFQQIGWGVYNPQGKTEYLPLGDNDAYDWQNDKLSERELYDILSKKTAKKEQIGVNLFYRNSDVGISLLAYTTEQIVLHLSINRKVVKDKHTDMIWYLENIVYQLFDIGVRLFSYEIEEYED